MSLATIGRDPALVGDVKVPGPPPMREDVAGQWPRMLKLDTDTESRLKEYLDHEISLCWQERGILVEDWIQWQKDYWAKPVNKVNNFPFKRAANIVIPMTAIAVEAIMARMLTTLFSVKPFYSIRPRITEWVKVAPQLESWLQSEIEDPNSLDMDMFCRESLLELIKLGTGVGKSGYEKDLRKVNIDLPEGGSTSRWVERKNGATLDYVPLANFLLRLHEKDPQTATWVGEEHRNVTWSQLKRNALSGRMLPEGVEAIKNWWSSTQSIDSTGAKYDAARQDLEGTQPAWTEVFSFCEIWLSFDVDGDGVDEEIVVDFHKDSRTFLSVRYNWYQDLHRPYRVGVFIPVEGRWAGIGVGKQLEQFQPLITTVHRQRLDAGTLANMGQLAIRKSAGYTTNESIFPGKLWFVDDPSKDIREFSLSNTQHFAQISNEENARQYADKRTGVNEMILGMPHIGTPGTATSDLAKLAEGNKKFDMNLKNVRRWLGLLGQDILANYQQFGTREKHWLVRGEGGQWIEQFLQMPQEEVRRGAFVELTVTDSVTNKDVEQQKWASLFALLTGHYDKALERAGQVAGLLQDPTIFLTFAEMALGASNTAMRRLLETYSVPDIDSFLLDLEKMKEQSAQPGQGGSGEPGPDGGGEGAFGPAGGDVPDPALGDSGLDDQLRSLISVESF